MTILGVELTGVTANVGMLDDRMLSDCDVVGVQAEIGR